MKKAVLAFLSVIVLIFSIAVPVSAATANIGAYFLRAEFRGNSASFHEVIAHSGNGYPGGYASALGSNYMTYSPTYYQNNWGSWNANIYSGNTQLIAATTVSPSGAVSATR